MELVDGEPLDRVLDQECALALGQALEIGIQVLDGRRAAHEAGIASHLVERAEVFAAADGLARNLLEGGPDAARAMKTFLNELDGSLDDEMLDRAAQVSADVIASDETQARLRHMFGDR